MDDCGNCDDESPKDIYNHTLHGCGCAYDFVSDNYSNIIDTSVRPLQTAGFLQNSFFNNTVVEGDIRSLRYRTPSKAASLVFVKATPKMKF